MLGNFSCTCSSLEEFRLTRETIQEKLNTICPNHSMQLFVAINEAVNNAFFHGINDHKGTEVTLSISNNTQDLCITVSHNGEGFTPAKDCAASEVYDESGRGIDIIKHFVDSLEFSACGREVIMHKKLNASAI